MKDFQCVYHEEERTASEMCRHQNGNNNVQLCWFARDWIWTGRTAYRLLCFSLFRYIFISRYTTRYKLS